MHIGDHSGHTTLEFDPQVMDAAREAVDAIFAEPKGRAIYAVADGAREQVRSIDEIPASATEVHVISPLVGG